MKVNTPFDVTSAQTTSKPSKSKGNSTSTDTLFGSILGQKSQGSGKTNNSSTAKQATASKLQANASEGVQGKPSSSVKKDDPQVKTDPKDTKDTAEIEPADGDTPQADDTQATENPDGTEDVKAEEKPSDGGEKEDAKPEVPTDEAPQTGQQIFIQPGPIFLMPGTQMDATAPPVIQQPVETITEQPVQTVPAMEMPIMTEEAVMGQPEVEMPAAQTILAGETSEAKTQATATQNAEPVLEVDPELVERMAAPVEKDDAGQASNERSTQNHAAVKGSTTDKAEAFAAQVVSEAKDMVDGQKGNAAAEPTFDTEVDPAMVSEEEEPADMDQGDASKKDTGATQKTQHTAVNTAQVADNGRVDFRLSGAQPLEAQNVPQEVREFNMARVVDQVRTEITPDKTEFYIQLKPDHLGGLSIALVSEDKGVVAKLMTSSQQVHNALQADMNQMVQMLRDKGINVVQMEVIYDQTANSMMNHDTNQQQQQHSGGSGNRTHGRVGEVAEEAMSMYDTLSSYEVLTEQGGSVEYTA